MQFTAPVGAVWGLVYVPNLVGSCFIAYKYVQWFKAPDDADTRGGLVLGWNVAIISFTVTYILVAISLFCIMKAATSHVASVSDGNGSTVKIDTGSAGNAVGFIVVVPVIVAGLIGCCVQAYWRLVTVEYAKDAGWGKS